MSNLSTTETTKQYGFRKPDGSVTWDQVYIGSSGNRVVYSAENLARDQKPGAVHSFLPSQAERRLEEQAREAGIDPEEYIRQWSIISRDIIIIKTEAERVCGVALVMNRIAGYTYEADLFCPAHITEQLPTGEGQRFEGWAVSEPIVMTPEENLAEIAAAFGIDREDETTFDSGRFPKRVYAGQVDEYSQCGVCGEPLIETDW